VKAVLMLFAAAWITACAGGQIIHRPPEEFLGSGVINAVDPMMPRSALARYLVLDIEERYGAGDFASVGVRNPPGYDFSDIVKTFSVSAGVTYAETSPGILVDFRLEEVDGLITGPRLHNYRLSANLIRKKKLAGGDEVIRITSERVSCSTEPGKSARQQCESKLNAAAEKLLYRFCCHPEMSAALSPAKP